jgi:mono/diheme cytochrome c family protein
VFAADAKAGQAVFEKSCKGCHGADGTPNAGVAKMLKADIPDLKSAAVQALGEPDLKKIISDGKGKMKPVKSVAGSDADNVVAYIRTLKK